MLWTSVERYLFIFHESLVKRHRIALHYVPIGCIGLYAPVIYVGLIIVYQCQPKYNIRLYNCGGPCYSYDHVLGPSEWIVNGLCAETLVLIIDVAVIARHLIQRHRMKRIIFTANARREWVRQGSLSLSSMSQRQASSFLCSAARLG